VRPAVPRELIARALPVCLRRGKGTRPCRALRMSLHVPYREPLPVTIPRGAGTVHDYRKRIGLRVVLYWPMSVNEPYTVRE